VLNAPPISVCLIWSFKWYFMRRKSNINNNNNSSTCKYISYYSA
jgi:hypothetical protein